MSLDNTNEHTENEDEDLDMSAIDDMELGFAPDGVDAENDDSSCAGGACKI